MSGKLVEFPRNNQIFFEKAISAFEAMKYDEALSYMKKMDKEKLKINEIYLYAMLLFQTKQVERAFELVEDYEDQFMNNEEMALLYVQILIHNRQFFKAQALIERFLRDPMPQLESYWLTMKDYCKNMVQLINQGTSQTSNFQRKELAAIEKARKQEDLSLKEQALISKYMDESFSSEYVELIEQLLIDDQMNPFIQRELLETLVDNGMEKNVDMHWLGEQETIELKNLPHFADQPIIEDLIRELEATVGDANPSLKEMIAQQIYPQLLLLYPLASDVITDPHFWILENIDRLTAIFQVDLDELDDLKERKDTGKSLSDAEEAMMDWMDRVDDELLEYSDEISKLLF